MFIYAI